MSEGAILAVTLVIGVGIAGALIATMTRAILAERRSARISRLWANFGLSMAFLGLFLVSWVGQAIAEWGTFVHEARAHGDSPALSDYLVQFGQSTFENWQSEFLQLFSFVVFSALLIHHGSAESKDGTDRIEQTVKRIESRLDEAGIGSPGASSS
jgi:ABC-type Fe3+-siderophore transport system permease subunit